MKRILYAATFVLLLAFTASPILAQESGGRYDQQILSNIARVLAGNPQYQNVAVQVDDGMVTLSGSVEADSARRLLEAQINHIEHVTGVVNQIVLSPPTPADDILRDRIISRLADAGFPQIAVEVRDGKVVLKGTVRTQRGLNWVKDIVSLTPEVKKVDTGRLEVLVPSAL